MDRLLIRGEPTSPYQYLYVFKNDGVAEKMGVGIDDLVEIVFDLLSHYELENIDLSGPRMYTQGIERMLTEANLTTYNSKTLSFRYV